MGGDTIWGRIAGGAWAMLAVLVAAAAPMTGQEKAATWVALGLYLCAAVAAVCGIVDLICRASASKAAERAEAERISKRTQEAARLKTLRDELGRLRGDWEGLRGSSAMWGFSFGGELERWKLKLYSLMAQCQGILGDSEWRDTIIAEDAEETVRAIVDGSALARFVVTAHDNYKRVLESIWRLTDALGGE